LREARGETALLGEEFGIHLPRHVRTFVADLPGVGSALSAAFAANAILFVVQALDQGTKKLADWIYSVKDASEANREWNKSVGDADAKMKAASHSLEDYGNSADDLARENITCLVDAMNQHNAAAREARFELSYLTAGTAQYNEAQRVFVTETKLAAAATDEHTLAVKRLLDTEKEEARAKALANLKTEIELRKELANVQVDYQRVVNGLDKENADEERYQISLKALRDLAVAEQKYGKDSVDEVRKINAQIETLQSQHALRLAKELKKETDQLTKNLGEMQRAVVDRAHAVKKGKPMFIELMPLVEKKGNHHYRGGARRRPYPGQCRAPGLGGRYQSKRQSRLREQRQNRPGPGICDSRLTTPLSLTGEPAEIDAQMAEQLKAYVDSDAELQPANRPFL
jgi:hypothetical protein